MTAAETASASPAPSVLPTEDGGPIHRRFAVEGFNDVWSLLDKPRRTADEDLAMIHGAHASRWHWERVGGDQQRSVGEWQISRVYAVLGHAEAALFHARKAHDFAMRGALAPFYHGAAHEALARAHAVAGRFAEARKDMEKARGLAAEVADPEERKILLDDVATISIPADSV